MGACSSASMSGREAQSLEVSMCQLLCLVDGHADGMVYLWLTCAHVVLRDEVLFLPGHSEHMTLASGHSCRSPSWSQGFDSLLGKPSAGSGPP